MGGPPETGKGDGGRRFRRVVALFLPGLPQLFGGRRLAGGAALAAWVALWAVVWARYEAIPRVAAEGPGGAVAVGSLLVGLVGLAVWSGVERRWARAGGGKGKGGREGGRETGMAARFARNRLAVTGLLVLLLLSFAALLAPLLSPYDPTLQGDLVTGRLRPPSPEHLLGTDPFARDVLSRLLHGARISLTVGILAVTISVVIGTGVGGLAGYLGGGVDRAVMRLVDMVLSFPLLVLLIAVVAMVEEPSVGTILLVLGLTLWPSTARLVRGEVLAVREREYVEAVRALGYSEARILFRHVLPNAVAPAIVAAALGVGNAIVLEAGLSFLGIGVQPPAPSWGNMLADGRSRLLEAWWISTFPGLSIVVTVVALNLVGDGLRDAFDPRR